MNASFLEFRSQQIHLFYRFLLMGALLGAAAVAHGQQTSILATDKGSNYSAFAYAGTVTPSDGGSGWGAFQFNSASDSYGAYVGTPTNTGLIGNYNGWGLYASGGGTASMYRSFDGMDIIGDTISVDLENTATVATGAVIGWSLWNASQQNLTEFYFTGGNNFWTNPDSAGSNSLLTYTTNAIQTDLTITSSTTYSLTAEVSGGSPATTTVTGTFQAVSSGLDNATGTGDLFRFFNYNQGSNQNIIFNNENVYEPTYSGGSGNFSTTGSWYSNGQQSVTPINGANVAFGGTATASATNNLLTTVNSYIFNTGAGAYTLSGSGVTLGSGGADNAGVTNNSSNTQTINQNLTIGTGATGTTIGATATAASGPLSLTGTMNLNSSRLLVTGGSNTTISGVVTGASDILKQGTGTLILNNASNNFGTTTSGTANVYIDAGTVSAGVTGALGSTDGATYGYVNVGSSVNTESTNNTALLISSGGVTVSNPIDARYFTGNTYGTQQIGGSNSSGTATFSGAIALHNSLTISSTSGGTVNISGAISQGVTTGVFSTEAINGTPGITTIGNGTVTLSASNGYSGPTTVNGGTLIVSGSLTATGTTTIASGATLEDDGVLNHSATTTINGSGSSGSLQGTGSLGAITANGGTIDPGLTVANSASTTGTLTAAGNVTLSSTTTFGVRLGYGSAAASDQLALSSGAVSLSGSLQLTLGGSMSSAPVGQLWVIVDSSSAGSGQFSQGTAQFVDDGYTFRILYNQNDTGTGGGSDDVDVDEVAGIPEPGTWGMIFSGFGVFFALQRLRKNRLGGR